MPGYTNRRPLVHTGEESPHQLPGATSATLVVKCFAKDQRGLTILLKMDNTTAIAYINRRGGTISPELNYLAKDLWLWCLERETYPSLPSTFQASRIQGQIRLEAMPSCLSGYLSQVWTTGSGPFHFTAISSTTTVCQLETRPSSDDNRCLHDGLVTDSRLCQPALEPGGESPGPDPSSTSQSGLDSARLEGTTMVCSFTGNASQNSPPDCQQGGSNPSNPRERSPGHYSTTSRVGYLRERYRNHQLSEKATELLLASWRQKSSKSYDSLFRKWISWCNERDADPVSGPVSEVVNFLADLFEQGYQYRSLNSYRSAISSVHDKVDGYEVGQHPLVTRLLKGVFHERPPQPRYSRTWDVSVVTSHIDTMGENTVLSLQDLTQKLVMLLALTRPSRSADLSGLNLRFRKFLPEGVVFAAAELAKQSRQSFFPAFPGNGRLCPVKALQEYELRTID